MIIGYDIMKCYFEQTDEERRRKVSIKKLYEWEKQQLEKLLVKWKKSTYWKAEIEIRRLQKELEENNQKLRDLQNELEE